MTDHDKLNITTLLALTITAVRKDTVTPYYIDSLRDIARTLEIQRKGVKPCPSQNSISKTPSNNSHTK